MKYEILKKESVEDLENAVNQYIANGWDVQGGVSTIFMKIPTSDGLVSFDRPVIMYFQALVKRSNPEESKSAKDFIHGD